MIRPALLLPLTIALTLPASGFQTDEEIEALVAQEREQADGLRRRGQLRKARGILLTLLEEEPEDPATATLMARVHRDACRWEEALELGRTALADARRTGDAKLVATCARDLSGILLSLGRADEALATLEPDPGEARFLDPAVDSRDALALGRALEAVGDREAARRAYGQGLSSDRDAGWDVLLAKGRCEWALGRLADASRSIVLADRAAKGAGGPEAEVLAALGRLYFESEREVEAPGKRSAGAVLREALELCPLQEEATLALFELHRYNRQRRSRTPEEILGELLTARPDSIEGLIGKVSADLSDGQLKSVRVTLALLGELAPMRREVQTLQAALAWVEHRRETCEEMLAELARVSPADARPDREVGRHLIELYRFSESLPFLERAVERDATDWEAWTYLGRALANTGDEEGARAALASADKAAEGRQDAWRKNTALVLERLRRDHVVEDFGELDFSWRPDAADVLRTYMVPFYRTARLDLASRYGHTPGETLIEVFRKHGDFSVRSVGFEGFPALGVCFGPVVTALSPLSEMRGTFSWARTGFHEYSHVVHLGLSHNRCPRWITEGLATYEEVRLNPTWTRNMRRELVDAFANDDLIPVRELNRAFRGPRILFGYYQGGLLCEMLIARYDFQPMIGLLEAFDRGLDLDTALKEVFGTTPEEIDSSFREFVAERIAGLGVEPRWQSGRLARLRLTLGDEPPAGEVALRAWAEGWTTVAWGSWQRGRSLDMEEALRRVRASGLELPRVLFLRGRMALNSGKEREAAGLWRRAISMGGREYRSMIALAMLQRSAGRDDQAQETLELAQEAFPGFDDRSVSAELKLAELHASKGRDDERMAAIERWLAWNPGEYERRMEVARWHSRAERWERASVLFGEANEVDPFRRDLHLEWAAALVEQARWEEALRELGVALQVPAELDPDHLRFVGSVDLLPPGADPRRLPPALVGSLPPETLVPEPLGAGERAEILRDMARCARELGREEDALGYEAEADGLATD